MRPPSKPKINKKKESTWFIEWNHDVPFSLLHKYKRKRIRIKIYDDINRYKGFDRELYADERLKVWDYLVTKENYNPFLKELNEQQDIVVQNMVLDEKIETAQIISLDENRSNYTVKKALECFMLSRKARKLKESSITSYQGTVDWISEGLTFSDYENLKIGAVRHIHLSSAIDYIAEDRDWNATTINKEVGFLMTVFNWLETEEYVLKNPSKKKFIKLPTKKNKHRWYDRETAVIVKKAVLGADKRRLYNAMQFTYWLCIRSKSELRKLKIGDIDRKLKRVRFSSDLSKNSKEQYRDYPPEFEKILDEMKFSTYPKNFYVFGKLDGEPSDKMCGHNFFSKQFKPIKDKLELSMDYTVYGWKHTRLIHEYMKGTDTATLSHMARHTDFKTTEDYLRDFDINLKNVYDDEDLTF